MLVNKWDPQIVRFTMTSYVSTLPANNTTNYNVLDTFRIPQRVRPDGAAASAATGGTKYLRFKVTKVTWANGQTISTLGGTQKVALLNLTTGGNPDASGVVTDAAAKIVAVSAALVAGDVDIPGDQVDCPVQTSATTRADEFSTSVPDMILFGGDKVAFGVKGSNAADLIKLSAHLFVEGVWETQHENPAVLMA